VVLGQRREQRRSFGQLPVAQALWKHQDESSGTAIVIEDGDLDLGGGAALGAAHAVERALGEAAHLLGVPGLDGAIDVRWEALAADAAVHHTLLACGGAAASIDAAPHGPRLSPAP
jgi:hypothetical protein